MLLQDLFENMASNPLDQLIYNSNKMSVLYMDLLTHMVKNLYSEGLHEDMKRTVSKVVGQQKGRWFAENFLSTSSRRENPTAGMKNALLSLSKNPKYSSIPELSRLGHLEINMDVNIRTDKGISFGKHMNTLETLPIVLKLLSEKAPMDFKDKLKFAAVKLKNAIDGFYNMWETEQERWDKEWGKNAEAEKEREAKQRERTAIQQTAGTQNSQADNIINQVLGSLDKKVAHEIRTRLARSDNKLQALQQELAARGIRI